MRNGPKQNPQFRIFLHVERFEIRAWHFKIVAHTPVNKVIRRKLGGTSQKLHTPGPENAT